MDETTDRITAKKRDRKRKERYIQRHEEGQPAQNKHGKMKSKNTDSNGN